MNPTIEHIETFFFFLLSVAFAVSGTSLGEAVRDRRAVKELAPENERAVLNVNRALRNDALRVALFLTFLAASVRGLYLPPEAFPRSQIYITVMFILLILAKIWGAALDRRDRIREMQPIYSETEGSIATADKLAASKLVQRTLDEIKEQVVTMNEGTLGSFAADDETRRIEDIPRAKRTPTEQRHLDAASTKEPAQGSSR